jgi:hypothetical protein
MKRFGNLGAAGVLVLIASMWVRSYWVADYFFIDPDGEHTAQVVTTRGQLHAHFCAGWLLTSGGEKLPEYSPGGTFSHLAMRPAFDSSRFLSFYWEPATIWERVGFRYEYLASFGIPSGKGWQCPLWFLCILTGLLPAKLGRSSARRWWRRKHGLCAFCGYDRRATTGLCPECGKEAAA